MFKVICVMAITRIRKGLETIPRPEVGDIDTVRETFVKPSTGSTYYSLERFDPEFVYHAECFAILPDQSAEDMREQNHESIIYQR